MGVSTDGIICYGIALEDGCKLPWQDEKWDGDEEEWWMYEVCGYKNPFELFDEYGEWVPGMEREEEKHRQYYDQRREFKKAHPLPIEVVRHCSGEYMMYIIAAPGTVRKAARGYPEEINVDMFRPDSRGFNLVIDFCDEYGIDRNNEEPRWWLCSMWW